MTQRNADIVRAWKDPDFRDALPISERMTIPNHPAGHVEVPIERLESAVGGSVTMHFCYTLDVGAWCEPTLPPACS
jgi:mersacidin/lichenicidin family type 2 lantibiotic